MPKPKIQRFTIAVTGADASYKKEFDFEVDTHKVLSVQCTASSPDKAYFRGTQRIEINNDELYPDGYESKLLMSNSGVAPDQRFVALGEIDPGNRKLKITYQDAAHTLSAFAAYTVTYVFQTIVK
jgi:hypothetical protein